jgi:septal ring factor EnvC (AmiA/AmiB activator)
VQAGREQNYWPGFVDALSNVVLTLLFVIVFALAVGMNKAAQQMSQLAQSAELQKGQNEAGRDQAETSEKIQKEDEQLRQRVAQAEAEVSTLREEVAAKQAQIDTMTIEVAEKADEKRQAKSEGVKVSGDIIVITYPLSVADLDAKASDELAKALEAFKNRLGKRKVTIRSIQGGEPFSAAQRYAYYRAVAIRNILLSKGVAVAADISSTILEPQGDGGGRVEISF